MWKQAEHACITSSHHMAGMPQASSDITSHEGLTACTDFSIASDSSAKYNPCNRLRTKQLPHLMRLSRGTYSEGSQLSLKPRANGS
jgi:hypothetical protein